MPDAATENVADFPAVTVWLAGCVLIEGGTTAALTVSAAALLVTLLALLLTTTVNCAPLSAVVVAGDRKSVVEGKRVDLGGRRIIKKKETVAWAATENE